MNRTILLIIAATFLITACSKTTPTSEPEDLLQTQSISETENLEPTQPPTETPIDTPVPTDTTVPATPTPPPKIEITDPAEENLSGYIDVVSIAYYIVGETLVAEMQVRELPEVMPFNRPHVQLNRMEYKWDIFIDLDNDTSTGSDVYGQEGAVTNIAAAYFIFEEKEPEKDQIGNRVQVNFMEAKTDSPGWSFVDHANLSLDVERNLLVFESPIPGITPDSRVFFQTAENHPELGYITDQLD